MSHTQFTTLAPEEMDPKWQPAWNMLNRLTGAATFVEVFAQAPEVLDFVMNKFYMGLFFGGNVAQRYKQLARLRLSLLHGCRTCNKQNIPGAVESGFSQRQIESLICGDASLFTPAEQAVIEYAEQVALTNMKGEMSARLFAALRTHFSEADILELGTVMAVISGMAKLSFVLNIVETESYCPFKMAPS